MSDKIILDKKGNKWFWRSGDLHISDGVVKAAKIKTGKITTHLGKELLCLPADFLDKTEKITRGPAIMAKKDIGVILANIPLDKNTKIVDAGAGCGMLAAFLARHSDKVTSYESNEKHATIAKKNWKLLEVEVKLKNKDIYQGIDERNVDVITLDLQSPENVLSHAEKSLKIGGYIVIFSPHISQVQEVIRRAKESFLHLKTIELIERKWIVEDLRLRPEHMGLLHTGFITFLRKVE